MKPLKNIGWLASAPILLFAGSVQAAALTISDPYCANFAFDAVTSTVACVEAASTGAEPATAPVCSVSASKTSVTTGGTATLSALCNPAATSWNWTASSGAPAISGSSGTLTFSTAGSYTYRVAGTNTIGAGVPSADVTIAVTDAVSGTPVVGTSCPAPAPNTVIVNVGTSDSYARKDFDVVFDNSGSTFDSAVTAGQTRALQFTNGKSLTGFLSGTTGNYGGGYKDWALSLCPGDFTASLGDSCVKSRRTSVNMYYSTDGSQGCKIPANQPLYLNIRGTADEPAGFVLQNVQMTAF